MSREPEPAAEEFARRLAALTPASRLSRDQVLYDAGRKAGRHEMGHWRFAAATTTLGLFVVLAIQSWSRSTPPMASRGTSAPIQPSPATPIVADAAPSLGPREINGDAPAYVRLRDTMLQRGADALPPTMTAAGTRKSVESRQTNDDDGDRAWWRLRLKQMGGTSL